MTSSRRKIQGITSTMRKKIQKGEEKTNNENMVRKRAKFGTSNRKKVAESRKVEKKSSRSLSKTMPASAGESRLPKLKPTEGDSVFITAVRPSTQGQQPVEESNTISDHIQPKPMLQTFMDEARDNAEEYLKQVDEVVSSEEEEEESLNENPSHEVSEFRKKNDEFKSEITKALESQDNVRNELKTFLTEMTEKKDTEGESLVDFPKDYEEIVELMMKDYKNAPDHILSQYVEASLAISDKDALKDFDKDNETVEDGIKKIRKLDLMLQKQEKKVSDLKKNSRVKKEYKKYKDSKMSLRKFILRNEDEKENKESSDETKSKDSHQRKKKISKNKENNHPNRKDFQQRNAELGPKARYYQLTEEEKIRVEKILAEGDDIFVQGEGYEPTHEELEKMAEINQKLQNLLPENECASIISNTNSTTSTSSYWENNLFEDDQSIMSTRIHPKVQDQFLDELHQKREDEEEKKALKKIDSELGKLYAKKYDTISEDQLKELIEQAQKDMANPDLNHELAEENGIETSMESITEAENAAIDISVENIEVA